MDLNKYLDSSAFSSNKDKNLNNSSLSNNVSNTYNSSTFILETSRDFFDQNLNENMNDYFLTNSNIRKKVINSENDDYCFNIDIKEKMRFGRIEAIKNEIKGFKINSDFLKNHFKQIKINTNKSYYQQKHLINLFDIQSLNVENNQEIWVAKFRHDGKYLATGGKAGCLKIWEITSIDDCLEEYEKSGIQGFFKFFKDYPYRIYKEHTSDIIDVCWSFKVFLKFLHLKFKNIKESSYYPECKSGSYSHNVGFM